MLMVTTGKVKKILFLLSQHVWWKIIKKEIPISTSGLCVHTHKGPHTGVPHICEHTYAKKEKEIKKERKRNEKAGQRLPRRKMVFSESKHHLMATGVTERKPAFKGLDYKVPGPTVTGGRRRRKRNSVLILSSHIPKPEPRALQSSSAASVG